MARPGPFLEPLSDDMSDMMKNRCPILTLVSDRSKTISIEVQTHDSDERKSCRGENLRPPDCPHIDGRAMGRYRSPPESID